MTKPLRVTLTVTLATIVVTVSTIAQPLPHRPSLALNKSALDRHGATSVKTNRSSPARRHPAFASLASSDPPGSLPTFSRSFVWGNTTYNERIVGSDPAGPAKTTTITTIIVPLRFEFANGVIRDSDHDLVDGQTVLADVLGSPFFNPTPLSCGPTFLGSLQYADAFQRANFWSDLKNKPGYHLLLAPTVAPTKTIVVPADEFVYWDQYTIAIDEDWINAQVQALIPGVGAKPNELIIFLAGHDIGTGGPTAYGFHDVPGVPITGGNYQIKLPATTYIVATSYSSANSFIGSIHASETLSHELIEWLNDPYVNNEVPAWEWVGRPPYSQDVLEACDPFEFFSPEFPVLVNGSTYYMFEAAFFDYFSRAPASRSANSWYTFHNRVSSFSMAAPTDADKFVKQDIDFPGAIATFPLGINDRGDIVGVYEFADFVGHGFIYSKGTFQPIDLPGASQTTPFSINDSRKISGYFQDATGVHGFLLQDGHSAQIDYPGLIGQTILNGINNSDHVVGTVYPNDGSPSVGFLIGRDGLKPLPPLPFGFDVSPNSINDSGVILGVYDDFDPIHTHGYVENGSSFSSLDFPAATSTFPFAVNNQGNSVGSLVDEYGFFNTAFYKRGDTWLHLLYGTGTIDCFLEGMNNSGTAVGAYFDSNTGTFHGMVLTPIPSKF